MAIGYTYDFDPFTGGYSLSFMTPPTPAKPAEPEFKFKSGDKVQVKIDAPATVEFANGSGTLNLRFADGSTTNRIPSKYVTLKTPDNFPPKAGQVWRAGGKNYGVRKFHGIGGTVVIYPVDESGKMFSDSPSDPNKLADFAKLRPVLVG